MSIVWLVNVVKIMKLIGIDKNLESIKIWLEDWQSGVPPIKKSMLLLGPPGVGKTSSVYKIAEELGFDVCEFNMSDRRDKTFIESLIYKLKSKPLVPTVFLFDEIDGAEHKESLVQLSRNTKNPIFFTANEQENVPKSLYQESIVLKYQKLRAKDILEIVGEVKDYSALSGDARQSLLVKYGSEGYSTEKHPIEKFLHGELDSYERWVLITILDNAPKWLYGYRLYELIKALEIADKTKNVNLLNHFKGVGMNWTYSYYYSKLKILKEDT